MKVKCNLRAGMTFPECDVQRDYMKRAAQSGYCAALGQGSQQPSYATQLPSTPPAYVTQQPSTPPAYPPPSQSSAGGGYFAGAFYPDRSGTC